MPENAAKIVAKNNYSFWKGVITTITSSAGGCKNETSGIPIVVFAYLKGTIYLLRANLICDVISMGLKVKARYENKMLKPFEKLDLKEGEEVEIEVPISVVEMTFAVSKLSDEIIDEVIETTERGE